MCMGNLLSACMMSLHHVCTEVSAEARRQCLIPWNWIHSLLWSFMCLPGIEPRSFARVASSLNLGWVIAPIFEKKQTKNNPPAKKKTPNQPGPISAAPYVLGYQIVYWSMGILPVTTLPYHTFFILVCMSACMYVCTLHTYMVSLEMRNRALDPLELELQNLVSGQVG